MKNLVILVWILAILMATEVVQASDNIDPTNGNKVNEVTNYEQIIPEAIPAAATVLDNFNRANGPIGSAWTNRAGSFMISNNAAVGSPTALATYNGISSNIVEADVQSVSTSLEYVGLVLGYASISNNIFLKVQNQDGDNRFDYASCYIGNNGYGFGLGHFLLNSPFTTAHMRAELSGTTVTITFSKIDGGSTTQTYTCTGAPTTLGTGVGIVGYSGVSRIDNFAVATSEPTLTLSTNKVIYAPGETVQLKVAVTNPTTNTYASKLDIVIILPDSSSKTFLSNSFSMTSGMDVEKIIPIKLPNSAPDGAYKIKGTLTYGTIVITSIAPFTIQTP